MATINDEQQMKGNLGGPDLFLAPIGRLEPEIITKHFCNTCEKEFEGPPKIEFENPDKTNAVKDLELDPGKKTLLATGASSGAAGSLQLGQTS